MLDLIEQAIKMGATNPPGKSDLHGESHWKTVALMGFYIARQMPVLIDLTVVYAFAQLHDICRLNDSNPGDPDDSAHGERAAELFFRMVSDPGIEEFPAFADRTAYLHDAIAGHVTERTAISSLIGVCWDADRLTLPRVGIVPDNAYLSTEVARSHEAKFFGRHLVHRQLMGTLPSWTDIRKEVEQWRFP